MIGKWICIKDTDIAIEYDYFKKAIVLKYMGSTC
jgi:hypothetical protein